jgi:hypothetical protein
MVAHTLPVIPAKAFVKESLTARSLVTPAQAGAHPPTARNQWSLGEALQLLEKRGPAEPWVPAFPTDQSPWAEGPREDNKFCRKSLVILGSFSVGY